MRSIYPFRAFLALSLALSLPLDPPGASAEPRLSLRWLWVKRPRVFYRLSTHHISTLRALITLR